MQSGSRSRAVGSVVVESACRACGYAGDAEALACAMCGEVMRREATRATAVTEATVARESEPGRADREASGIAEAVAVLLLGALLAPVFALTPVLQLAGWFLSSLVHEIGHCAVALATGSPAFPAISLAGHAATVHQEQVLGMALAIEGGLVWLAFRHRDDLPRCALLGAVALAYPLCALTGLRELLHLAGGHLAELAFGVVFFVRAANGGFTHSKAERVAHALYGWHLVGGAILLCAGLVFDHGARLRYAENGSFGLTNDMIRIAQDVVGCSLQSVALTMLVLSLATMPLTWLLVRGLRDA